MQEDESGKHSADNTGPSELPVGDHCGRLRLWPPDATFPGSSVLPRLQIPVPADASSLGCIPPGYPDLIRKIFPIGEFKPSILRLIGAVNAPRS